MAIFTEESVYCPEVTENGNINVKRMDKVYKDGVLVSTTIHRHVIEPGDDIANEDATTQAVVNAVWGVRDC